VRIYILTFLSRLGFFICSPMCPFVRSHLFCLDAWIGGGGGVGAGGGGGDRALELFEAYRGALCAAVSG
jgi:hypothetical protein